MRSSLLIVLVLAPLLLGPLAARAQDCGCDYHSGGCTISEAAPAGFKCVCVYKGWWSCSGWAQGCGSGEHCPGGRFDKDACSGDCGGY